MDLSESEEFRSMLSPYLQGFHLYDEKIVAERVRNRRPEMIPTQLKFRDILTL